MQLVPVGIAGAYKAWPRNRSFPRVNTIQIEVGKPLLPEEIANFDDTELIAEVQTRIAVCLTAAEASCTRVGL